MKTNFEIAVLGLFIYVVLVVGGPVPYPDEPLVSIATRFFVASTAVFVLLVIGTPRAALGVSIIFLSVAGLILVPGLLGSDHLAYAIAKSSDLLFGTLLGFMLSAHLIVRHGWAGVLKALVAAGIIVLILTLAFKATFGFWARDVRFLLNGPIVFGWLMGLMALIAWAFWECRREKKFLLLFFGFFLAVVWTESKGPLIALLLVIFGRPLLATVVKRGARLKSAIAVIILLATVWFAYASFNEIVLESRYGAGLRLLQGDLHESDEGSVGIRLQMLNEAAALAQESPWSGIGLGNWIGASASGFYYPHNQHVEVLIELGLFVFLLHLIFLSWGVVSAPSDIRWILVFLVLVASFSGDIAYLRYPFLFVLLSTLVWMTAHDKVICARDSLKNPRSAK